VRPPGDGESRVRVESATHVGLSPHLAGELITGGEALKATEVPCRTVKGPRCGSVAGRPSQRNKASRP
jgi:hypothetical protein